MKQAATKPRVERESPERSSLPCIVCNQLAVQPFLDLGETALANKFLEEHELGLPEPRFPLVVGFCHGCGHVQLTQHVPPQAMFEDYLYVSSASETLTNHLHSLSDVVVDRYRLTSDDLVMDIGCNDGTLLKGFRRHGVRTLGVDPAKNLAELYEDTGIDRYTGFFDSESAVKIRQDFGEVAVATATNTFPHIPALDDFVEGLVTALRRDGAFVIEAHYLLDILESCAFDTIYHEHVSYWALAPMIRLFNAHGLSVVDVERLPIHHGQLRAFVRRKGQGPVKESVRELLQIEHEQGIDRFGTYEKFAKKAHEIKRDLTRVISELRAAGNRVVGYGAPAKGNTLLGFLELGPEKIDYIVDRSPLKQGLFTPHSHIPVVPVERLVEDRPDFALLLAWNFRDEVLEQQAEYRQRGGRFIIPVPKVQII